MMKKLKKLVKQGNIAKAEDLLQFVNFSSDSADGMLASLNDLKKLDEDAREKIKDNNFGDAITALDKILTIASESLNFKKMKPRCLLKLDRLDEAS